MAKALPKTQAAAQPATPQSHLPEFASESRGSSTPHLPLAPMFVLVFSPSRWHVLGGRLVPMLSKLPLEPGINGVERNKDGRWRLAKLRARLEEEDRILIDFALAPDGRSYMKEVMTRAGQGGGSDLRPTYITVWESAHAGDSRTYTDIDGYSKWLSDLVQTGKLPSCPPYRIRAMGETMAADIRSAEAVAGKSPSGARSQEIQALTGAMTVLAEHLRKLEKPTTPEADGRSATPQE